MNPETIIEQLHPAARKLLLEICEASAVKPELVVGHCRKKPIAYARHEWWATLYGLFPNWSYPFIADMTGHDHTTVMMGHRNHLMRVMKAMPKQIGTQEKVA